MMDLRWRILVLVEVCVVLGSRTGEKSDLTDDPLSSGEHTAVSEEYEEEGEAWIQSEAVSELDVDYVKNKERLRSIPEPYEIVYPVQVRRNEQRDLDTKDYKNKNKHQHYHHTSLHVSMFGKRLKIKLDLNRELLSSGLKQKRHLDISTQMITEGPIELCYYKGKVKRVFDSRVVVSTCDGVRGFIQLSNETFIIQPLSPVTSRYNKTRFPHVVYHASRAVDAHCANARGMWHPFHDLHRGEFLKTMKILKTQQTDRDILQEKKFMELALVGDHSIYVKHNYSYSQTLSYLIEMANIIDSYMNELEIQVQLVLVDIWNLRDQVSMATNVRQVLQDFMLYREKSLQHIPHDLAHLITTHHFDHGESGMAIPDSVCSTRAVSVGRDPRHLDPQHGAAIASHYIGHTLGLSHDANRECCGDQEGCIMGHPDMSVEGPVPRHFSSCSKEAMNSSLLAGLGSCLFKTPLASVLGLGRQMTYPQKCGNGVVERGEECDCGTSEECSVRDPCCDPASCLLRSWASCRAGGCCQNCTVMSVTHMCRPPLTPCDVPEFCDGVSGQCPVNDLVQDGQPCRNGSAYCYRGFCHTLDDQCFGLWGEGASRAVDECFEKFNPTGNFNGHCGEQRAALQYRKCDISDIKCGLLHCTGGESVPRVSVKKTFTLTKETTSEGHTIECKIVNSHSSKLPYLGMVEDGTRCGDGRLCVNQSCVPIAALIKQACPRGPNNKTCSGYGVCTSSLRCHCYQGYAGSVCQEYANKTTVMYTRPTTTAALPTLPAKIPPYTVWYHLLTTTTTTLRSPVVAKEAPGVSTTWLIIVLAGVVGAAVVMFAASVFCYRRESPKKLKKAQKRKLFFNRLVPPVVSHSGSVASDDIPRLISFGNMPSYKADKMKLAMRKSGVSEGSEHSTGSQCDATELKLLNAVSVSEPPGRGILKKYPRSTEELAHLGSSSSSHLASFTNLNAERQRLLKPIPMRDVGTQGNTLEEGEYESLVSGQSGGEESEWSDRKGTPSDDDSCFKPTPSPSPPDSGKEEGGRSDSSSGSRRSKRSRAHGSRSDLEQSRRERIQNIEDLIRQIDAQASSLTQPGGVKGHEAGKREESLSPCNSEVEADQQLLVGGGGGWGGGGGGGGVYPRLSDCEEEPCSPASLYSPCNSPSHQYMPQPMPRLQRQYNPLQVDIPQCGDGPFSILENQSMHSNLSSSSRRFPSSSSTLTNVTTPSSPRDALKNQSMVPIYSGRMKNPSPGPPPLSPGSLSSSSKLSTFSSKSTSPSSRDTLPLSCRKQSPTSSFSCGPYSLRRSPELDLSSLPLHTLSPTLMQLGMMGQGTSPPPVYEKEAQQATSTPYSPRPRLYNRGTETKTSPKPSPLPRTTPVRPRVPSPRTQRKAGGSRASPGHSSSSSPANESSPGSQHYVNNSPSNTLTYTDGTPSAIPYRGAARGSASPTTSLTRGTDSGGSDVENPTTGSPKPPPRNPHLINKLTHPLLDGYPFKNSHHSLTPDIASNSEGYHSDRPEVDESVIIREIPRVREEEDPQYANHRREAYKSGLSDSIDL